MNEFLPDVFSMEQLPQWSCPTCSIGLLELNDASLKVELNAESLAFQDHYGHEPEYDQHTICFHLRCNNKKCCESVMATGSGGTELEQYYLDNGDTHSQYNIIYNPQYFHPHLKIFNAPEAMPEVIENMLNKSFSLFFCDSDSCGNRIRACVEFLLDELKVPREYENKGKVNRASLHSRIENLPQDYEKIKELLFAIKWLGNVGSHGNEGLTKKETIDAYEILKVVLDILYRPSDDHVFELAKKINEAKGVI